MAKLDFLLDGNHLGEFALSKERMTIGRRPTSDIHIDNLAVSGEHAVIVTIGNDSFLEDLNSTNGTMVNRKTVKKHVLMHDDIVEFGKYQLKYINEKQIKPVVNNDFEKTMIIRPSADDMIVNTNLEKSVAPPLQASNDNAFDAHNETTEHAPQLMVDEHLLPAELVANAAKLSTTINAVETNSVAEANLENIGQANTGFTNLSLAKENATGRLQVLTGNSAGREVLLNKAMVTLGKPGTQVAVITKRPHGFFITHVEGDQQPIINGKSIGMQAYALNNQDVIELSGTKMTFHLT